MKEEIKTLKDLKEKHGIFGPDYIGFRELKAEALKWLNELDHEHKGREEEGAIEFIIKFFNLNEEDLKEKEE